MRALSCSLFALAAAQSGPWPTQEPYWPHYITRNVTVLSGTWAFAPTAQGIDAATVPYASISTPVTAVVPGCTDIAPPGIVPALGVAFFRSWHACSPGRPALAAFGAVNMYARVFADGQVVGNHTSGGYTPFQLLLPPCGAAGTRELTIVNSNEVSPTLAPTYTGGDFFFYSGLIRPIVITELPAGGGTWIRSVEATTADAALGILTVRVLLGGSSMAGPLPPTVHLALAFHGATPSAASALEYPVVNGAVLIDGVAVPQPWRPWVVGDRNASLIELRVLETYSGDILAVRTGLRTLGVNAASARLEVSGAPVKLLGYNRHTLWPDTGAAVTPQQEAADVALLVSLNANYVRGAHYPQSQSFLDLCDEQGVAVWEEALGPGTRVADMNNSYFIANQVAAVDSMVGTSINHPSVVFHGFFNEGPSDAAQACVGYAALAAAVRARAGSSWRMVTWANNRLSADKCIAYEDVISFNSYPAWYDKAGNLSYVAPFWEAQVAWVAANHPSKPLTISETGGGAVYEWVNASAPGTFWSQSYQRDLVAADVAVLGNSTRVSALSLWQFSDIKVAQCPPCEYLPHPPTLAQPWDCASVEPLACGRPKGENNKGAVDWWRRKKLSFDTVAQLYAEFAGN